MLSRCPVDVVFADDSRQSRPSRRGMGPLVAVGGIVLSAEAVAPFSQEVETRCQEAGLPSSEEFKWSPGRELWMHNNLIGPDRESFYCDLLRAARTHDAVVVVVVCDAGCSTATGAETPEQDATRMFLERAENAFTTRQTSGFVVVDRPPGDRGDEDKFLQKCLETVQSGTRYVKPRHIAHNVLSTPSKLSRMLQIADLVTGCSLARVSGESVYSPPVFELIRPLMASSLGRIGGCGLKIHPDFKYLNLYHWLLHDEHVVKGATGWPLPLEQHPYSKGPDA